MYKSLVSHTAVPLIFLLIVNYLAVKLGWYVIFPWFDVFTHFLGGIVVGFGILTLLCRFGIITNSVTYSLLFLMSIFCIALGWEFYEIIVNTLLTQYPFDLIDTLWDIVNDLLGALVAFLWAKKYIYPRF